MKALFLPAERLAWRSTIRPVHLCAVACVLLGTVGCNTALRNKAAFDGRMNVPQPIPQTAVSKATVAQAAGSAKAKGVATKAARKAPDIQLVSATSPGNDQPGAESAGAAPVSADPAGDELRSDQPTRELAAGEESAPEADPPAEAESDFQTAQTPGSRPLKAPLSEKPASAFAKRLDLPKDLPGAEAPPITLTPGEGIIDSLFPELPSMRRNLEVREPGDPAQRLALRDVQELALSNNPLIVQAAADVDAAIGQVIDVGAYPNPVAGYEEDTVGSAGTRNYQGIYFTQVIKTAGKLELLQASANVDLMNTQLALRRARIDLITRIRTQYFAVLVAKRWVTINSALVRFTNEVYRVQVEQLKGGQAAAYEPMQLRALAAQARGLLIQAQNRYASAWRQLAATMGMPDYPLSELEGEPDMRVPAVDYEAAISFMLTNHTDVLIARNVQNRARIDLRFEEVTPIPDVLLYSAIQKDYTTPGASRTTYNLQVGVPLPIFNRNKGGILNAQGKLQRAVEEIGRVRNDLSAQIADAFERYETNRVVANYYANQILPDQSRVYRGVYERHQQDPDAVGFGDIIVAQQNLVTSITTYVNTLSAQWQAVTDLGGLLQLENLYDLEAPGLVHREPLPVPPPAPPLPPARETRP